MTDSNARRFEATVERTLDDRVVLDATLFYPEGGGQPSDHGTLTFADDGDDTDREWRVVDVQKRDTVYHELEPVDGGADVPPEGARVVGELDWERRWAHMRYHTAQHLLSAVLLDEFDAETVGNQLSSEYARLDAAYDRFTDDDLDRIETRLNDLVDDARPVTWYTMDRAEAEATLDPERTRIDLLPSSITDLRIVEVAGAQGSEDAEDSSDSDDGDDAPFDRTACAGTHVSNTRDVGSVHVTGRTTQGSGKERVTFELE
nr:alanyl-tRNA editing protein [Halomarina salina]